MMQKVKISDFAEVITGGTPSTVVDEYWDNGTIPWLQSGACQNCIIKECDTFITEEGLKNSAAKMMKPESVLIALTGATTGKVGYLTFEACANQSVTGIQPNDRYVPKYLYYYLMGIRQKILDDSYGGAQKHISQGYVKNLEVPLGTIEEQRTIVDAIEKVDAVISARKNELQLFDNLIEARFVEMFGESGKQVLLSDYVWFQEGPGVRSVDFKKSGTVLLTGSNINKNTISFGYKSDRFISSELAQGKYAHFMCDKDDILVVSSAIDPNRFDEKVTIVQEDKKYCLNTGIIRFKPNRDYLTLGYFREFLKTDYFKHQVMEEMRGIAQMHFGPSHLKKMTILLPNSIEKQIEFENFVTQIDKSKFAVQKALDKAQLLFDSLMQQFFC